LLGTLNSIFSCLLCTEPGDSGGRGASGGLQGGGGALGGNEGGSSGGGRNGGSVGGGRGGWIVFELTTTVLVEIPALAANVAARVVESSSEENKALVGRVTLTVAATAV
jgi:hypothetical protein